MEQLINVGFGNFLNRHKIIAVISPDSAPAKRMVQSGKDQGIAVAATPGGDSHGNLRVLALEEVS